MTNDPNSRAPAKPGLPEPLPADPGSLRDKAREYRAAAAAERDPERRRAFMLVAAEYDELADVIEREGDEGPRTRRPGH